MDRIEPQVPSAPRPDGQDSTSDLIIAARLTLLKFAHSALAPVTCTWTDVVDSLRSGPIRSSAARIISFASTAAPA